MSIKSSEPTQNPRFAAVCDFQSRQESSDGDSEAKTLQQAVKTLGLRCGITALENEIQDSVTDVAQRTLDKLREMAPNSPVN